MLQKIKWAYRLLRTDSYVVLTDKQSVINLPIVDGDRIEDIVLMKVQIASLEDFSQKLLALIRGYKDAERLLMHRKNRGK